jgi:hypothetical protein
MPARRRIGPLPCYFVLALGFTLLDAVKPLHMDDTAYYYYAAQIARHPLDPYGFQIFWYDRLQPATTVLAPPVLPYWWAAGIRLFGEHPFLWKLWLLPFSLLLVTALGRLFRRFAPGLDRPLLLLTVFSPTLLPSFNLMLDVPALALGLFALTLFLTACDLARMDLAVGAGLLAGAAMQTKYTGLLVPVALLLAALVYGRIRLGLVAAGTAALVFVGWECFVALRYGQSHFRFHILHPAQRPAQGLRLAAGLLTIPGAAAPVLILLGLLGLRWPGRWVTAAGCVGATVYLLLAFGPAAFAGVAWRGWDAAGTLSLAAGFFALSGCVLFGILLGIVRRFLRRGAARGLSRARRDAVFLTSWLLLEIVGYFVLTPFPAVRRLLGPVVVVSLLLGRMAAYTGRSHAARRGVWGVAVAGVLLGLLYFFVDLREARAQEEAAERAADQLREAGGTVWFVGHWGFQYYAERAGMRPVVPELSELQPGDWLVGPYGQFGRQQIVIPDGAVEEAATLLLADGLPLRTVPSFYLGVMPLEHHQGPRLTVRVYRVVRGFPARLAR